MRMITVTFVPQCNCYRTEAGVSKRCDGAPERVFIVGGGFMCEECVEIMRRQRQPKRKETTDAPARD